MRVRWKPPVHWRHNIRYNECCLMGCESSGSGNNNDTTQIASSARDRHVHVRPTQQFWIANSTRQGGVTNAEPPTRCDITVVNGNARSHDHAHHHLANGNRSSTQSHHGHRRCSNFQMADFDVHQASRTAAASGQNLVGKHNYIEDKNGKRTYLSSVL